MLNGRTTAALVVPLVLLALAFLFLGVACTGTERSSTRQELQSRNEEIAQRANRAVPVPNTTNFLSRQMVAEWMVRQDTPDRPYYIYVMADTGNFIGYYVAQSRPVNTCSFLTPPERVERVSGHTGGAPGVVSNPGLDGIYYGSGGACDQWFFFDAETDAMVELTGLKFFTSDQPLRLEVDPIRVETAPR